MVVETDVTSVKRQWQSFLFFQSLIFNVISYELGTLSQLIHNTQNVSTGVKTHDSKETAMFYIYLGSSGTLGNRRRCLIRMLEQMFKFLAWWHKNQPKFCFSFASKVFEEKACLKLILKTIACKMIEMLLNYKHYFHIIKLQFMES